MCVQRDILYNCTLNDTPPHQAPCDHAPAFWTHACCKLGFPLAYRAHANCRRQTNETVLDK